jgi:hypothetical protein
MALCPVDIGPLTLRTNTLFTPALQKDRSFYLSYYLSIYLSKSVYEKWTKCCVCKCDVIILPIGIGEGRIVTVVLEQYATICAFLTVCGGIGV